MNWWIFVLRKTSFEAMKALEARNWPRSPSFFFFFFFLRPKKKQANKQTIEQSKYNRTNRKQKNKPKKKKKKKKTQKKKKQKRQINRTRSNQSTKQSCFIALLVHSCRCSIAFPGPNKTQLGKMKVRNGRIHSFCSLTGIGALRCFVHQRNSSLSDELSLSSLCFVSFIFAPTRFSFSSFFAPLCLVVLHSSSSSSSSSTTIIVINQHQDINHLNPSSSSSPSHRSSVTSRLWERGASDLLITAFSPPLMRIDGQLIPIPGEPELDPITSSISC